MGTARPPHWGGHPKAPRSPSTHLGRAEDGLGEELDEGLVVLGGQDRVLQQPHCQPQRTQLSPAMTRGAHTGPAPSVGATWCCPGHNHLSPLSALTRGPLWCWGMAGDGTSPWWGLGRGCPGRTRPRGQRQGLDGGDMCQSPVLLLSWGTAQDTQGLHVALPASRGVLTCGHPDPTQGLKRCPQDPAPFRCAPRSSPAPGSRSCPRCPSPKAPRSAQPLLAPLPAARTPAPHPSAGIGFS